MPRNSSNGLERWRGEVAEALRDIRKNQDEQWESIERLGDRFEAALKEHAHRDEERNNNLETRINIIENSHSKLVGKISVYAIIGATAISVAIHKIFG